jgi:ribosomal protein L12E/L44/L45/RPP1/RPP2
MAVKGQIDTADKMGKAAQSAGMGVEDFSKLAYAAKLSDVEVDDLGKSLGKLAKAMSATAGGAAGPAAEAFKAIGVAVTNTDGTLKTSGEVLTEIAGKFQGYEDSAAKTALAIAIFGKAGAAMIPLLNRGAAGIAAATAEAEKYGVVIDTKMAAAAEAFNENMKRMSAITQGMWTQITANVLPAFLELSKIMLDGKEKSGLFAFAIDKLTLALKGLVTAGVIVNAAFKALSSVMSTVVSAMVMSLKGDFAGAWSALKSGATDTTSIVTDAAKSIANIWGKAGETAAASSEANGPKMAAPIIQAADKAKNALQSFLDSTAKQTAAMSAEAQTIGKSAYEHERLKIVLEAEAIAKANNIPITEALRQKIEATANAYAGMNERAVFGKQLFEQTRTPVEQFGIAMERLNAAMQSHAIDPDTYARGVAQLQQQLIQANPHARNLGTALESAFDRAFEKGAQLGDILRQLIKDLIKMEATTAFKSLLYGTQGGKSGGILSSFGKLFGFAEGGSFTVPVGSSGGIDSQVAAFKVSPGEQVTVDKNGGGGGSGGTTLQQTNYFSGDLKPSDRSWIESLVAGANNQLASQVTNIVAGDLSRDRNALGVAL